MRKIVAKIFQKLLPNLVTLATTGIVQIKAKIVYVEVASLKSLKTFQLSFNKIVPQHFVETFCVDIGL